MWFDGFFDNEDAIYESSANHPLEEAPIVMRGSWRTGDGCILQIKDMTDQHLRNAISYFERTGVGRKSKIRELREELAKR